MMAGSVALACANAGAAVAWVVPTYRNARPVWRFAERTVAPIAGQLGIRRTERVIEFPGGGWLGVYTADNPVSILGEAFDLVICEEAARIPPDVWSETIMPTLADRDGRAMLISTPRGRNWFWQEFQRGLADGKQQASFTAPSNANPSPNIRRAFELARERVSQRTFRQEWLAEFVEDGAFFVNVLECATAVAQPAPIENHAYCIGADWARSSSGDYTVFMVIDATLGAVAVYERLSGVDYNQQRDRLKALSARFSAPVLAEYNSMGGPQVEALQAAGVPVMGFTTTAATKHEIISALHLALEQKRLALLKDPILTGELMAYEVHQRTGLPTYGAPEGMHDDMVMALALAWWQVAQSGPLFYDTVTPEALAEMAFDNAYDVDD